VTNRLAKKSAANPLVALAAGLMMTLGIFGTSSCSDGYDPYYYDYTYYDPYYYGYDTWYAYTWVDPVYSDFYTTAVSSPADLNTMAATIASHVNDYYGNGCATATASGANVDLALNSCTGPGGKGAITGHITVMLSQSSTTGEISLKATSQDLTLNGERYVLDLTATPTTSGNQSAIAIVSNSYSPSRFDSRQSNMTVSWTKGSGCFDVNGTSQATRGGMSATATVSGFHQCTDACPSAGTVTVSTSKGDFTSSFNGGDQLSVAGPDGTTHSYDLNCNPVSH
jgi:hypothetical protein